MAENTKNKVLIITYYFPPAGGSGVQRVLKFVKYLRDFNWEPVVYTTSNGEYPEIDHSLSKEIPEGVEIIRRKIWEPYSIYKLFAGKPKSEKINPNFFNQKDISWKSKLSIWIRSNFFIPDARVLWVNPSVDYLEKYIKNNNIKAIITSGPPHSLHLIGLKLQKKLGIKWIADFRDPWTNIDFYKNLTLTTWADQKHRKLEKEVLSKANQVISVGNTWRNELQEIAQRPIHLIQNGYDETDMVVNEEIILDEKFTIVHIGMMGGARNHEVFWKAIAELIAENIEFKNHIKVELYGKVDPGVDVFVDQYQLKDIVNKINYMPHNEILKVQKRAQVLYLSVNNAPNAMGIITGKIYEYIGSNRPILCIGPENGDAALIINESQTGFVSGFEDKDKLKFNILLLFNAYLNNVSAIDPQNTHLYTRKSQTQQLAHILDSL